LPAGYTQLEYIETSGTQYINTGISTSNELQIEYTFQLTSRMQDYVALIFGASEDDYSTDTQLWEQNNRFMMSNCGGNYCYPQNSDLSRHHIIFNDNNGKIVWDGAVIGDFLPYNPNHRIIYVGTSNHTNTSYAKSWQRIYNAKFKNKTTGQIIQNLIPARRNSDGAVGMYDTVTDTFFTNAGTGTFIASPVAELPRGYTRLEYIESTGTQYINTGIQTSDNLKIEYTFQLTSLSPDIKLIFGASFGGSADYPTDTQVWLQEGHFNVAKCGERRCFPGYMDTNLHKIVFNDENGKVVWDGVVISDFLPYTSNGKIMFLGTSNNIYNSENWATSKIYGAKFENKTTHQLVANFIPARRNSDGVVGMYDTVTDTFFTNAGSGNFIAGYGIASTSYVQGMYEAINNSKMAKLNPNSIEFTADSSPYGFFTAVEGTGDKFRFKREEITLPFGSYDNPTGRMSIWLE